LGADARGFPGGVHDSQRGGAHLAAGSRKTTMLPQFTSESKGHRTKFPVTLGYQCVLHPVCFKNMELASFLNFLEYSQNPVAVFLMRKVWQLSLSSDENTKSPGVESSAQTKMPANQVLRTVTASAESNLFSTDVC
jgi:hypothetical protein